MSDWMLLRLLMMSVAIGLFVVAMVLVELWTRRREHGDRAAKPAPQAGEALPLQSCASCESFERGLHSAQQPKQDAIYKRAA